MIIKGYKSSPTCDVLTIKMHWNSVISTPNTKYATLDVKDFYLQTDLEEYEYIFFMLEWILKDFIQEYELEEIAVNGKVYTEVRKGMY